MTKWPDEDYSYPLADVSNLSEQEKYELRRKGDLFYVMGKRDEIESDEEFEKSITLFVRWNLSVIEEDKEWYEKMVMSEVKRMRFLWYHGRLLKSLREKYLPPFKNALVAEAKNGPLFDGVFLYPLELEKLRCMRAYFSYSFIADKNGNFSFKPWMDICIYLLEHIAKEGRDISDEQALHVNVRNVSDIVDEDIIDDYLNAPMPGDEDEPGPDKAFYGRKIYVRKMERLYYLIRLHKMQDWWEP